MRLKFDTYFLGLPRDNYSLSMVFLQITNNNLLPLKNVKKNVILFELFWYKFFVH